MKMNMPLYILSGIIGLIALYAGFSGKTFLFIRDTRTAVIVLGVVGFLMCVFGAIGIFVTKAPAHPLTAAGYVLGSLALLISLSQLFRFKIPLFSDPKSALTMITIIIIIKIVIARFSFLLPSR